MAKIWQGDDSFVVQTAVRDTFLTPQVPYGVLIGPDGQPSAELPLDSFAGHMPYTKWQPFEGDPAPILAALAKAGVKIEE